MPNWIRNNKFYFLRPMSVKRAVENGNICNKTTVGESLFEMSFFAMLDKETI